MRGLLTTALGTQVVGSPSTDLQCLVRFFIRKSVFAICIFCVRAKIWAGGRVLQITIHPGPHYTALVLQLSECLLCVPEYDVRFPDDKRLES